MSIRLKLWISKSDFIICSKLVEQTLQVCRYTAQWSWCHKVRSQQFSNAHIITLGLLTHFWKTSIFKAQKKKCSSFLLRVHLCARRINEKSNLFRTITYLHWQRKSYKNNSPSVGFWQVVRAGINLVYGKEPWACSTCQWKNVGHITAGTYIHLQHLKIN